MLYSKLGAIVNQSQYVYSKLGVIVNQSTYVYSKLGIDQSHIWTVNLIFYTRLIPHVISKLEVYTQPKPSVYSKRDCLQKPFNSIVYYHLTNFVNLIHYIHYDYRFTETMTTGSKSCPRL